MPGMRVTAVTALAVLAATSAAAVGTKTIAPLTKTERAAVIQSRDWHRGCPVSLSQVRLLAVRYYGFDHRSHWGRLVVNAHVAADLRKVFAQLYEIRFPIHHMQFGDTYGSLNDVPKDGDFTASFECREASASPCTGVATNKTTGSWSEHAYGAAVDLNPVENPYVGCGMTRDKTALSYLDRARYRKGMVNDSVVRAFASIGWGWGGSWSGATKDYMHFSVNGH
jgi:hypothetical protein